MEFHGNLRWIYFGFGIFDYQRNYFYMLMINILWSDNNKFNNRFKHEMKIMSLKIRDFIDAETIGTREAASVLDSDINKKLNADPVIDTINIDFTGISFISRSFADEIRKLKEFYEKRKKKVEFTNLLEDVGRMIDLVSRKKPTKRDYIDKTKYEVITLMPHTACNPA